MYSNFRAGREEKFATRDLSVPFSKYGSINLSWSLLCQSSTVNLSNYFFFKESLSLNLFFFFSRRKYIFYLALLKLTGENATVILQSAASYWLLDQGYYVSLGGVSDFHGDMKMYRDRSEITAAIARCHWSVMGTTPEKNARQQKVPLTRILSPWRVSHCDMRQRHAFRSTGWRPKSEKKKIHTMRRADLYSDFYLIEFRMQAKPDSRVQLVVVAF